MIGVDWDRHRLDRGGGIPDQPEADQDDGRGHVASG